MFLKNYNAKELCKIANKFNDELKLKIKDAVDFFNGCNSSNGIIQLSDDTADYYWNLSNEKRKEFLEELIRVLNESNNKTDNFKLIFSNRKLYIHFYYEKFNMLASEDGTVFGDTYINILKECAKKASLGYYEVKIEVYNNIEEELEELIYKLKTRLEELNYIVNIENISILNINFNIKDESIEDELIKNDIYNEEKFFE